MDVATTVKVTTMADGMLWGKDGMWGVWSHNSIQLE
jgi:hypothetical protein